jgi:hypothetical protein
MADTIYTPSEMLDRVEARVSVLRRELAMLDAWIEEATLEGDTNRARRLTEERAMCAADIALLFQNVI